MVDYLLLSRKQRIARIILQLGYLMIFDSFVFNSVYGKNVWTQGPQDTVKIRVDTNPKIKFNNEQLTRFTPQKVDPRQYITIYEKKRKDSEPVPIWWLEKRADTIKSGNNQNEWHKLYSKQTVRIINSKSQLEIKFDQEALADNLKFFGNISLKARSGEKSVEVAPYYVIGEQQKSYGVNSKPIEELADNFLRLIIEAKKAELMYKNLEDVELLELKKAKGLLPSEDVVIDEVLRREIPFVKLMFENLRLKHEVEKESFVDYTNHEIHTLEADIDYILGYVYSPQLDAVLNLETISYKDIDEELNRLNELVQEEDFQPSFSVNKLEFESSLYQNFITSSKRAFKFMDYFNSAGHETMDAFLSLTSITRIDFASVYSEVSNSLNYLDKYSKWSALQSSPRASNEFREAIFRLDQLANALSEVGNGGAEIHRLLEDSGYTNDFVANDFQQKILYELDSLRPAFFNYDYDTLFFERRKLSEDLKVLRNIYEGSETWRLIDDPNYSLLYDSKKYKSLRDELAHRAGEELFSKLVFATIDLEKAALEEGSVLEILVTWYNIGSSEQNIGLNDGVDLPIALFEIAKTGWYVEPSETVALVNRINEDLVQENVSPSNFKPTAGASLLWSYYNDHRADGFKGFLRWLEPSFGINVSYLDFSTQKNFEIGAGPVLGIFNNKLFFVTGYNFSIGGESPFYFGIGFSFLNVFETINSSVEKNK